MAAEAEALRVWAGLQKEQVLKLQKRNIDRARLRKITARVAELKNALERWDKAQPTSGGTTVTDQVLDCRLATKVPLVYPELEERAAFSLFMSGDAW